MPCIAICPILLEDAWFLEELSTIIFKVLHCQTELIELLQDVDFAYHEGRKQYYSTAINRKLDTLLPPQFIKVLGITKVDLFIPILTHVYGEAQLNGRACIVSTHRLRPTRLSPKELNIYKERMIKEGLHELGHTFNLRHCQDSRCIMHYCRNIKDVDQKKNMFCPLCRAQLEDALGQMT